VDYCGNGNVVEGNAVYRSGIHGIAIEFTPCDDPTACTVTNPTLVRYNRLVDNGRPGNDYAGIQLAGSPKAQVYYNLVYDSTLPGNSRIGIWLVNGSHDVLVAHNSIYQISDGSQYSTCVKVTQGSDPQTNFGGSTGANVVNNVAQTCGDLNGNPNTGFVIDVDSASQPPSPEEPHQSFRSNYNDWFIATGEQASKFSYQPTVYTFKGWQTAVSFDVNGESFDPLWVAPGSDFHVNPGSPVIDAGVVVVPALPPRDFYGVYVPQGSGPDQGASEFCPGGVCMLPPP
jgi:hypothetical protein